MMTGLEVGAADGAAVEPNLDAGAGDGQSVAPTGGGEDSGDESGAAPLADDAPAHEVDQPFASPESLRTPAIAASAPPRVNDAMRVLSRMQIDLDVLTEGKRAATYDEVDDAFDNAIRALGIRLPSIPAAGDDYDATKPGAGRASLTAGGLPEQIEREDETATASDPANSMDRLVGMDSGGITVSESDFNEVLDQPGEADASEALGAGGDERSEGVDNNESNGATDPAAMLRKTAFQAEATGQRMNAQQKREHDTKHGLLWHLGNIYSGRNWDGSRNEAAEARAQAERATSDSFIRAIRRVDKAATDTKVSPKFFYVQNPPMSFFDFPIEPPRIGVAQVNVKGAALATLDLATVLPWGKALGILRADLTAAEDGTVNLVPRLGPNGVDPARHNANLLVSDSSGKIVTHQRLVSGNMTTQEKALGFPKNMLAAHTEARAVRGIDLRPGDTVTITGQLPPCTPCRGSMNQAATRSGATIKYQWRQGGKTLTWVATPKRK
ncbi:hypothetical protein GCM10009087_52200 [Sphingomonas oligophenolica]|uniref:Uncharacterized protein n=1 Tax=Sphingomonas oligophenolica TaxID=301154 RepID=A0ABU9Y6Y4_9SPHN